MTECYMLLLTPEGEVRDFCCFNVQPEQIGDFLRAIAQSGDTILSVRVTNEARTRYLDTSQVNDLVWRYTALTADDSLSRDLHLD